LITSTKNPKIKEVRALQASAKIRREANLVIIEGVRLAEEVVAANWRVQLCLYTEDLTERGQKLIDSVSARGVEVALVADHVMKSASDTQTPQGVLMLVEIQEMPLPASPDFVLVLDQMRDPGNAGTLLRTAAAAGVQAVLCTPGSVDPFSPKVVRSAMGAHFQMPVETMLVEEITELCQRHGLSLWAAAAGAGQSYYHANLTKPSALVIGSEASGVSSPLMSSAQSLHIPMPGEAESLNAAAAGAVLMFEILRQRTTHQ
jgi:TrmH family RNA methyltransferase